MTDTPRSDGFAHYSDVEVRFRDTDAMGHVNNAVYLTYIEVARQAYWRQVAREMGYDQVPFVVAHASLDFRSPSRVDEVLRVFVRTDWVSRGSFGLSYKIRERDSGRLVCDAETVLVTYDYATHRPMPVPDWMRRGLEETEGRQLPAGPQAG